MFSDWEHTTEGSGAASCSSRHTAVWRLRKRTFFSNFSGVFSNGFFTLRFVFSLGIDCQVVTVVRTNTCGADDHWQVEVSESATAREAGVFLVFLSPFLFTAVVPTLTNFGTHDLWIEF